MGSAARVLCCRCGTRCGTRALLDLLLVLLGVDQGLEVATAIGLWRCIGHGRQLAANGERRALDSARYGALDSARYGALLYHRTVAAEEAAEEAAGLLLLLLLLLLRLLLRLRLRLLLLPPRSLACAPLAHSARAEELGTQEALEAAREHHGAQAPHAPLKVTQLEERTLHL
jgi:hypothetical protein